MITTTQRQTWPLWQCLKAEALAALIIYQWEHYGLKLDLLADIYRDVEGLEEIDRLMRKPPEYKGKVWFGV